MPNDFDSVTHKTNIGKKVRKVDVICSRDQRAANKPPQA